MRLSDIAAKLDARFDGEAALAATEIRGVATLESATPADISFLTNAAYGREARKTQAAAVLCAEDFKGLPKPGTAVLRCKDPHLAYAKAIQLFYQPPAYKPGVHPSAVVDPSAKIGSNTHIGALAVVGPNVVIGEDCVILSHVVIYEGARIGNRFFAHAHSVVREHCHVGDDVILQNGAVIGSDGFGFAMDKQAQRWQKIPQSGNVVLGNEVEVQANSCIDRATLGETRIERGARIDNLVQVAHGCTVGENTMLCSQVGLAGSSDIGKNVLLAGQVGVAGHCHVGDGVIITAQSGIHGDIPPGKMLSGSPAFDHKLWLRAVTALQKLPELIKKLRNEE